MLDRNKYANKVGQRGQLIWLITMLIEACKIQSTMYCMFDMTDRSLEVT